MIKIKNIDLTKGKIGKSLLTLSIPIILTNFIQTAYGMVDMIWIGRLGSGAVAAVGTASFFVNLGMALYTLILIGTGVKIAQALGGNKKEEANKYISNSLILTLLMGTIFFIFILIFKDKLIGFYNLSPEIENLAVKYLLISVMGIYFIFTNSLFTTILTSCGNSKVPFVANSIGFIFNILLDPLLIFGVGGFKGFGVVGAALATLIARVVVTGVFLLNNRRLLLGNLKEISFDMDKAKEVLKMGAPITAQRVTFTIISIIIGKIVADFGATAIAVQRVGVQIESISYMTIGGLQGAIASFVGQNYGANKLERIKKGYKSGFIITVIFGLIITILFMVFPKQIFGLFMNEDLAINAGISYLRILALSQIFMCLELFTVGAFNGIGKTYAPPIVSIIFTALRIPLAIFLSMENVLGIDGVWFSISISSLIKGILLVIWFVMIINRISKKEEIKLKNV